MKTGPDVLREIHHVLVQLVKIKALGDIKLSFVLLEIIKVINAYY